MNAIGATGGADGGGLKATRETSPPLPTRDDRVSGLLDAIRKAGGKEGAGLKSIKEQKAEERKRRGEEEAAPPPSGGGGDLMGDLMSKLTMRRKGISGTKARGGKDPEEQGGGDAMDKVGGMIPPPTAMAADSEGEEDKDNDWD